MSPNALLIAGLISITAPASPDRQGNVVTPAYSLNHQKKEHAMEANKEFSLWNDLKKITTAEIVMAAISAVMLYAAVFMAYSVAYMAAM